MTNNHISNCYGSNGLVDSSSFERSDVSKDTKIKILNYLKRRSFVISASSGRITDMFTHKIVEDYCAVLYSDGIFEWDSHDIYYFENYNMKLIDDFIKHALSNIEAA